MRKISTPLILTSILMLSSLTVLATSPTNKETQVTYSGIGTQGYEIIVPSKLEPGQSGKVTAIGYWDSTKRLDVLTLDTVILTNSIDQKTKELNIVYDDIHQLGNNTSIVEVEKDINIENIQNALFGTWDGTIEFSISLKTENELAVPMSTYNLIGPENLEIEVYNPTGGELLLSNSDSGIAIVELNGDKLIVEPLKAGSTTVTLMQDATDDYYGSSAEININIEKKDNTLSVEKDRYQILGTANLEIDITNESNGELSLENSISSVATATISDGKLVITPKTEGVTVLTLKSASTDLYNSAEIKITIDVSHDYVNGTCSRCGEKDINTMPAGLYDSNWNLKTSWQTLINNKVVYNNNGVITGNPVEQAAGGWKNSSASSLNGILVIPEGAEYIAAHAFINCNNLTGVVIPSTLKSVYGGALTNTAIKSIIVKPSNTNLKTVGGILYDIDMNTLYRYPINLTNTSFTIPSSVTTLINGAFNSNKYLNTVNLHNGIEVIPSDCFSNCTALTNIVIPDSVHTITGWAFSSCTNLTSIYIPDSVTIIGTGAFSSCTNLKKIYIPSSVKTLQAAQLSDGWHGTFTWSTNVKIYCGASSKPSGWSSYWNYAQRSSVSSAKLTTYWGYTRAQYNALP